jgi:hypothetical protein
LRIPNCGLNISFQTTAAITGAIISGRIRPSRRSADDAGPVEQQRHPDPEHRLERRRDDGEDAVTWTLVPELPVSENAIRELAIQTTCGFGLTAE